MNNPVKIAFTLVEILITLVIIGVIAAMTLPSLINKINNAEIVAGVKKYQSILSQVITKYEADNGCIGNLSACEAFVGEGDHVSMWNALKPYFNAIKDCGIEAGKGCFPAGIIYKYLNGQDRYVMDDQVFVKVVLADKVAIIFHDYPGNCNTDASYADKDPMIHVCADIVLDINGSKSPNQFGRDVFAWYVTRQGTVLPLGNYDDSNRAYSNGQPGCDPSSSNISTAPGEGIGSGCTAKILKESAINY